VAAKSWKEWEKPLIELEEGITKLKALAAAEKDANRKAELEKSITDYESRRDNYIAVMYSRLGPWEKVLVARADKRPYALDYVAAIFTEFTELEGDRRFGADHAIVGGPAFLEGRPCMVIGHQKGRNIQERQHRNFAMAKPEGYRKAIRLMDMAERFRMPVITLVDTPAADPGVESESRGIAEAIAASMFKMFQLTVPTVAVVIGEGGSGGAIGLATANAVLMQEHAIYSVIPPEGCAAILWRMPEKAPQAAAALKLTAQSALELELIDEILTEPRGGAHRDVIEAAAIVKAGILQHLQPQLSMSPAALKDARYDKFRKMGRFTQAVPVAAVGPA
jgi:acetyl-CoA carboxylase carboxyl transferase subunit alpha